MTAIDPLHRVGFALWACFIIAFWGLMGSRAFAPEIYDAILVHAPVDQAWLVWGLIATMAAISIQTIWSLPTILLMSLSFSAGIVAGLIWQIVQ